MPKRQRGTADKVEQIDLIPGEENGVSESEESVFSGLESESSTEEENTSSSGEEDSDDSESLIEANGILQGDSKETTVQLQSNNTESDYKEDILQETLKAKNMADGGNHGESIVSQAIFEDVDTSDEEDIRNTVGNIPMEWYQDYPHIGYNLDGKRIMKPAQGDELDAFLDKMDNPDYWRTVYDKTNMKEIKLSDEELDIIQRIQGGKFPVKDFDPYEPYTDWFSGETMIHPIKDTPESKSSFIPSKWEHKRVMKIVRAIRNGWIKPKAKAEEKPKFYLLWDKEEKTKERPMHWAAPKLKLPGHEESYNPPTEYLPNEEEIKAWEDEDPEDRTRNFLPKKYSCLRHVPGYPKYIQERFERCLDLYLCPRQRKVRLQVNPDDLIPALPRPRDLQPFPSVETLVYRGHTDAVTSISIDPTGQWLVSASKDKTVRYWEVSTGRCIRKLEFDGTVNSVSWNPSESVALVSIAVNENLIITNPLLGDKLICSSTDDSFNKEVAGGSDEPLIKWERPGLKEFSVGYRFCLKHKRAIKQTTWHVKGDYLAAVQPDGDQQAVVIHQVSKRRSQCPFKKAKGVVQAVQFHPTRPFFFVATQRYVRVYNLQKQELSKKLVTGVQWISSLAIHPQGDNLIIGSYDKRLCWFDMDLSAKPYKILRNHKKALRQVAFHSSYPLFASASDDGTVIVCHGRVFNDLMQNPLIVPVKVIRGHQVVNDIGVTDCIFHPAQPWIFSAGADKTIRLFT